MKYSSSKEIHGLIRKLVRSGWTFRHGRKHGRIYPPGGKYFVTVPISPSDRRSRNNFERDLRRMSSGERVPERSSSQDQA